MRKQKLGTISIILFFSAALTFSAAELYLRSASFSSGIGAGKASQKWFSLNWKPINKLGYRDYEIEFQSKLPQILFLGDSFSAGHGVNFSETFYFHTRQSGGSDYQFVNLADCGASTKKESAMLNSYVESYHPKLHTVIHQYFGNDIDDYIKSPSIEQHTFPNIFVRHSEFINLLDALIFSRRFAAFYSKAIYNGYHDERVFGAHVSDLKQIHDNIRKHNARLVFLIFPFLDNDQSIQKSSEYLEPLSAYFRKTCLAQDVMIDTTPIAQRLPPQERVVNKFDAHPSARLHQLVSETLIDVLKNGPNGHPGALGCPFKGGNRL